MIFELEKPRDPLMDPRILTGGDLMHVGLTVAKLEDILGEAWDRAHAGKTRRLRPLGLDLYNTGAAASYCLHAIQEQPSCHDLALTFLTALRDKGALSLIEEGTDRGIAPIIEWNDFVQYGRTEGEPALGWRALLKTPLAKLILEGVAAAGKKGMKQGQVGADTTCSRGDFMALASGMVRDLIDVFDGRSLFVPVGGDLFPCRHTGAHLTWANDALLAPRVLEVTVKGMRPLQPLASRAPVRHVQIHSPSGKILMADWFRIEGFSEGVEAAMDPDAPDISSHMGVDLRTQACFEELGLMRIHATNCAPSVLRDGAVIRVAQVFEDDGDDEDAGIQGVDHVGRICCDLWDVTFADREILIDIIVAGREILAKADDHMSQGLSLDRSEIGEALDRYAQDEFVTTLSVEPGAVLNCYMATGAEVSAFRRVFQSPAVEKRPAFQDLFLLSQTPLPVAPELLEDSAWQWPGSLHSDFRSGLFDNPTVSVKNDRIHPPTP